VNNPVFGDLVMAQIHVLELGAKHQRELSAYVVIDATHLELDPSKLGALQHGLSELLGCGGYSEFVIVQAECSQLCIGFHVLQVLAKVQKPVITDIIAAQVQLFQLQLGQDWQQTLHKDIFQVIA
jgi:hypothetical protein